MLCLITRCSLLASAAALVLLALPTHAQGVFGSDAPTFTRADTLRGSITPERAWWDVTYYDLRVAINPPDSSIRGVNHITYKVLSDSTRVMQIDLMTPLEIDSMIQDGKSVPFRREGNLFYATLGSVQPTGTVKTIAVYYHGKPRVARNAPWDGGFVWTQDSTGTPWIATACQGVGASIWWPVKDIQSEEPDSQSVAITVPNPLMAVSNGRLRTTTPHANGTTTYVWFVSNPINNYNVSVNVGAYAHLQDTITGESGTLTLDYWPLALHRDTAQVQFAQSKPMLHCFEHWFGPYPFYEDGFKLVETPFLGMEHQSAIAYGNRYMNGYRGRDLSKTGWGLRWDFIIVHEAGHEWFGNNITTNDIADMWVHESFTNYAEGLYTECQFGKEAGAQYLIGLRQNVRNDIPVTGRYGVNNEGSGDMYYKGSNMLHTMRHIVNDDTKWRSMLRGLNQTFRHKTVTGRDVQEYMNRVLAFNFDRVFEQYLTTTKIPILEYRIIGDSLAYRWTDVVDGFDMPVRVLLSETESAMLRPTTEWQRLAIPRSVLAGHTLSMRADSNFYVTVQHVP